MKPFERYAPAIAVFFMGCAGMALIFGVVVFIGGSPVTPAQYGPIVYKVPALVWASLQFTLAAMATLGAANRWPVMAAVGAGGISALLGFFAAAAAMAGATGTMVVAGGGIWLAPISSVAAVICWRGRHERRSTAAA